MDHQKYDRGTRSALELGPGPEMRRIGRDSRGHPFLATTKLIKGASVDSAARKKIKPKVNTAAASFSLLACSDVKKEAAPTKVHNAKASAVRRSGKGE